MNSPKDRDDVNPSLRSLYWVCILPSIAHKLGLDATPYVKARLHEMHKKYLNYPTTSGVSQEVFSSFVFEVGALWACHGYFIKMKKDQPEDLEWMPLKDAWKYL